VAGDLYVENITYDQFKVLGEAGAEFGVSGTTEGAVFHADKSWYEFQDVLKERLSAGAPSDRRNLPAHSYVAFRASNRQAVQVFAKDPFNKARLNNFLAKCSRPLGMVAGNSNLQNWPGAGWDGPVTTLLTALDFGNVIIEYYKYDGSPIMNVQRDWKRFNE
jgi:hypothetical protein